jgi:tetratricopeptide (TPR) repeat protein
MENYKKALEYDPENHQIWFKLAETYLEVGSWLESKNAFEQCIKLNPEDANSYYGKAKVCFVLLQTQEAISCLKTAFTLDPEIKTEFVKEYPEIKSSKLFKKLLD